MNRFIPFLIMTVSCAGCGKREHDKNIDIEISGAHTWKADLKKETYTIFYRTRPPLEILLDLTNEEKEKLIDTWYFLELDQIQGKRILQDNCLIAPKLYTVIRATTHQGMQEISIDDGCEDFKRSDSEEAENVKKFIQLVRDIIFSRPSVRDAPKSNITYM